MSDSDFGLADEGVSAQAGTLSDDEARSAHRQAYARCIRWLGMRDHCCAELRRKLGSRDVDDNTVESVLAELLDARFVDDERYAQTFAEQRSAAGYGPRYISAKLYERGLDRSLTSHALEAVEADWQEIACDALCRRFHGADLADDSQRQQGRMARFLQARGFSTSDSISAMRAARKLAAANEAD